MDGAVHPTLLECLSAWVLIVTFAISLAYELWRVVARPGVSRYDSWPAFWRESWLYVLAAVVIVLLLLGVPFAAWIGLVFSVVFILVSILYYNPQMMAERKPGIIDWIEDLVYTGGLFIAAAFLTLEVSGLVLA